MSDKDPPERDADAQLSRTSTRPGVPNIGGEDILARAEEQHELFNQGRGYLKAGDFFRASETLHRAVALAIELDNRSAYAEAMDALGKATLGLGDGADALTCFTAALEIHRFTRFAAGALVSLRGMGAALNLQGRHEEAMAALYEAWLEADNADRLTLTQRLPLEVARTRRLRDGRPRQGHVDVEELTAAMDEARSLADTAARDESRALPIPEAPRPVGHPPRAPEPCSLVGPASFTMWSAGWHPSHQRVYMELIPLGERVWLSANVHRQRVEARLPAERVCKWFASMQRAAQPPHKDQVSVSTGTGSLTGMAELGAGPWQLVMQNSLDSIQRMGELLLELLREAGATVSKELLPLG